MSGGSRAGGRAACDRAQMPGGLRLFDDRWGLAWRVANVVRRASLRRELRFQLARFQPIEFDRPIFIIGASRSGTTTLFQLLSDHPELGSLRREGHDLWRKHHHPRRKGWISDAVGPGETTPAERRFVARYLRSHFKSSRFVEKTPENCLRIPYLLELFPGAHFVLMKRDPLPTLLSLIRGWRHPQGKFRSYFVPETLSIPGYDHERRWCFTLIEGWRQYRSRPIPEIAAEQWRQLTDGALAGRDLVPADRWHEIALEELIRDPVGTVGELLDATGLVRDPRLMASLEALPRHNAGEDGPVARAEEIEEALAALAGLESTVRDV